MQQKQQHLLSADDGVEVTASQTGRIDILSKIKHVRSKP